MWHLRWVGLLMVMGSALAQTRAQRMQRYQPQPDTQMTGDFSLSGSVVDGTTGEPIRKATVNINGGGTVPGNGNTLTDGSGSFRFTHLEAGQYTVRAEKPGYSGMQGRNTSLATSLGADHPNETLTCKLMRNGTLSGKVVDENDEPLPYANVQVMRKNVRNGHRQWLPSGGNPTNDLGEYRLSVQPGEYMVEVTVPSNMGVMMGRGQARGKHIGTEAPLLAYPSVFYPNAKDLSAAIPMAVGSGQDQRADFRLTPAHAVMVSGKVVNFLPNHGISMSLAPAGGDSPSRRPGAAVNGNDGTFQFSGILPGRYILNADLFAPPNAHLSARTPLTVGDADITDLSVNLAPTFDVPVVVHAGEGAAANVQVTLSSPEMPQQYSAGGNANLNLQGVVPGNYQISITSAGAAYVKSASLGGTDVLDRTIELNAAPGPITVELGTDGATLTGEVANGDTKARNARIVVLRRLPTGEMVMGGSSVANETGQFTVNNLAPGEYVAFAMDDSSNFEYAEPATLKKVQDFGQSVTLQAKGSQQLKLQLMNHAQ